MLAKYYRIRFLWDMRSHLQCSEQGLKENIESLDRLTIWRNTSEREVRSKGGKRTIWRPLSSTESRQQVWFVDGILRFLRSWRTDLRVTWFKFQSSRTQTFYCGMVTGQYKYVLVRFLVFWEPGNNMSCLNLFFHELWYDRSSGLKPYQRNPISEKF